MSFTSKTVVRVISDDGYFYEIDYDADGLGNVEIRYFEKTKAGFEQMKRMSFEPGCVKQIIAGLQVALDQANCK
jgi:hypothetical protein